jgi:hypothetical protein
MFVWARFPHVEDSLALAEILVLLLERGWP